MYIAYNFILLIVFVLVVLPYFIYRTLKEDGFFSRFKQSLGFLPDEEIAKVAEKNCIWIHAASVGEIVAASPIVKEIRRVYPNVPIMISAVTVGGYSMAKQIMTEANTIVYFPLDIYFIATWVVERIRPRVFLLVETELWPNMLRVINKNDIPVVMVNGRISDKSVKRYGYLGRMLKDMLNSVDKFCMQSEQDALHICQLGANPERVVVTGNTKFDQTYAETTAEDKQRFIEELALKGGFPIIVAGSTHEGEEAVLMEAFNRLHKQYPQAKLVLAPRKPARIHEVASIASKYQYKPNFRKALLNTSPAKRAPEPVAIIDTLGELGRLYAIADMVFVGGSIIVRGGHNVLEPAAHGKPILVGPNMNNFRDSYNLLNKNNACRTVANIEELTATLFEITQNDELRKDMGDNALKVVMQNRGATERTVEYLQALLDGGDAIHGRHLGYVINNAPSNQITIEGVGKIRQWEAIRFYIYRLIHGKRTHIWDYVLLAIMRVFSWIYGIGVNVKLSLHRLKILKTTKLDCVVISLGNITAGGTGKTPTAHKLATMIRDAGYSVVILNRGYKSGWEAEVGVVSDGKKIYMRAQEAGDEAYLLAKSLPGVSVVIGTNRAVSGEYVVKNMQPDVIILDDGYQHWKVARDLDIVLIDTVSRFGNGYLLPRGVLREPLSHLDRADVVLLTRADQSSTIVRDKVKETIRKYNHKAAIFECSHSPCYFVEIADWYKGIRNNKNGLEQLKDQCIMTFSAIGNPTSFEKSLENVGADLVETIRYPDHHDYGMVEMQYIVERAVKQKAKALVTTEKDAVKIPTEFIYSQREIPIYILGIEVDIFEGDVAFEHVLKDIFERKRKK